MGGRYHRRLLGMEGRKNATDEELLGLYKNGWFINQIRRHYKVGLPRLRRIAREHEETIAVENRA